MSNDKDTKHRDIDGGYAWIILLSSFLCIGLGAGFRQIFGILYVEILDIYQAGKYLTSWIITLQVLFWGGTGKILADLMLLLVSCNGSAFVFCDCPFESEPSPTSADACGEVTGCAMAAKRLACVAPEETSLEIQNRGASSPQKDMCAPKSFFLILFVSCPVVYVTVVYEDLVHGHCV